MIPHVIYYRFQQYRTCVLRSAEQRKPQQYIRKHVIISERDASVLYICTQSAFWIRQSSFVDNLQHSRVRPATAVDNSMLTIQKISGRFIRKMTLDVFKPWVSQPFCPLYVFLSVMTDNVFKARHWSSSPEEDPFPYGEQKRGQGVHRWYYCLPAR